MRSTQPRLSALAPQAAESLPASPAGGRAEVRKIEVMTLAESEREAEIAAQLAMSFKAAGQNGFQDRVVLRPSSSSNERDEILSGLGFKSAQTRTQAFDDLRGTIIQKLRTGNVTWIRPKPVTEGEKITSLTHVDGIDVQFVDGMSAFIELVSREEELYSVTFRNFLFGTPENVSGTVANYLSMGRLRLPIEKNQPSLAFRLNSREDVETLARKANEIVGEGTIPENQVHQWITSETEYSGFQEELRRQEAASQVLKAQEEKARAERAEHERWLARQEAVRRQQEAILLQGKEAQRKLWFKRGLAVLLAIGILGIGGFVIWMIHQQRVVRLGDVVLTKRVHRQMVKMISDQEGKRVAFTDAVPFPDRPSPNIIVTKDKDYVAIWDLSGKEPDLLLSVDGDGFDFDLARGFIIVRRKGKAIVVFDVESGQTHSAEQLPELEVQHDRLRDQLKELEQITREAMKQMTKGAEAAFDREFSKNPHLYGELIRELAQKRARGESFVDADTIHLLIATSFYNELKRKFGYQPQEKNTLHEMTTAVEAAILVEKESKLIVVISQQNLRDSEEERKLVTLQSEAINFFNDATKLRGQSEELKRNFHQFKEAFEEAIHVHYERPPLLSAFLGNLSPELRSEAERMITERAGEANKVIESLPPLSPLLSSSELQIYLSDAMTQLSKMIQAVQPSKPSAPNVSRSEVRLTSVKSSTASDSYPKSELHSAPAGLSTPQPQAKDGLRAEVRERLSIEEEFRSGEQASALERIRITRNKKYIPLLIEALGLNYWIAQKAIDVLYEFGSTAEEAVLNAAQSENSRLRANAISVLGLWQNRKFLNAITQHLDDTNIDILRNTIVSLELTVGFEEADRILQLHPGAQALSISDRPWDVSRDNPQYVQGVNQRSAPSRRAEVRLTPVESSTAQPLTVESQRAELRQNLDLKFAQAFLALDPSQAQDAEVLFKLEEAVSRSVYRGELIAFGNLVEEPHPVISASLIKAYLLGQFFQFRHDRPSYPEKVKAIREGAEPGVVLNGGTLTLSKDFSNSVDEFIRTNVSFAVVLNEEIRMWARDRLMKEARKGYAARILKVLEEHKRTLSDWRGRQHAENLITHIQTIDRALRNPKRAEARSKEKSEDIRLFLKNAGELEIEGSNSKWSIFDIDIGKSSPYLHSLFNLAGILGTFSIRLLMAWKGKKDQRDITFAALLLGEEGRTRVVLLKTSGVPRQEYLQLIGFLHRPLLAEWPEDEDTITVPSEVKMRPGNHSLMVKPVKPLPRRAEVRSIPVESSTLEPREKESPRAEVREKQFLAVLTHFFKGSYSPLVVAQLGSDWSKHYLDRRNVSFNGFDAWDQFFQVTNSIAHIFHAFPKRAELRLDVLKNDLKLPLTRIIRIVFALFRHDFVPFYAGGIVKVGANLTKGNEVVNTFVHRTSRRAEVRENLSDPSDDPFFKKVKMVLEVLEKEGRALDTPTIIEESNRIIGEWLYRSAIEKFTGRYGWKPLLDLGIAKHGRNYPDSFPNRILRVKKALRWLKKNRLPWHQISDPDLARVISDQTKMGRDYEVIKIGTFLRWIHNYKNKPTLSEIREEINRWNRNAKKKLPNTILIVDDVAGERKDLGHRILKFFPKRNLNILKARDVSEAVKAIQASKGKGSRVDLVVADDMLVHEDLFLGMDDQKLKQSTALPIAEEAQRHKIPILVYVTTKMKNDLLRETQERLKDTKAVVIERDINYEGVITWLREIMRSRPRRAEVRKKDSSESHVSSLKLEKLETRNPKPETNFNRAELRLTSVKSSTALPLAEESQRAELRQPRSSGNSKPWLAKEISARSLLIEELERVIQGYGSWATAIAVFAGARVEEGSLWYNLIVNLGRKIKERGIHTRAGGGPKGMEAPARGAAGMNQAIRINLPFEQSVNAYVSDYDQERDIFQFFDMRKRALFHYGTYGAVVAPGGIGSLDEGLEALSLGLPTVFFSYWRPILKQIMARGPFPFISDSPTQMINYILKRSGGQPFQKRPRRIQEVTHEFRNMRIHHWSPAVTFVGNPPTGSRELQIAAALANRLITSFDEPIPIRVSSRGPLLSKMVNTARNNGWLEYLQGLLLLTDTHPALTQLEHELLKGNMLIRTDKFAHRFLEGNNAKAYIYLPNPYSLETASRLFRNLQVRQAWKGPRKPILLLGKDHYGPLMNAVRDTMGEHGLISRDDLDLVRVVDSVDEAWDELQGLNPKHVSSTSHLFQEAHREMSLFAVAQDLFNRAKTFSKSISVVQINGSAVQMPSSFAHGRDFAAWVEQIAKEKSLQFPVEVFITDVRPSGLGRPYVQFNMTSVPQDAPSRAELRKKNSSEFKVSSLKLEQLETRNPKLETNFNRAELRLTSVKSSTAQPSAVEGRRAELRLGVELPGFMSWFNVELAIGLIALLVVLWNIRKNSEAYYAHLRTDSVIRFFKKVYAWKPQGIGFERRFGEAELDVPDPETSERWGQKIKKAIDILREKNFHDLADALEHRTMIVAMSNMETYLLYSDPEQRIYRDIHSARTRPVLYLSAKYLDEIDAEVLADRLSYARRYQEGHALLRRSGASDQKVNRALKKLSRDHYGGIVEPQKIDQMLKEFAEKDKLVLRSAREWLTRDGNWVDQWENMLLQDNQILTRLKKHFFNLKQRDPTNTQFSLSPEEFQIFGRYEQQIGKTDDAKAVYWKIIDAFEKLSWGWIELSNFLQTVGDEWESFGYHLRAARYYRRQIRAVKKAQTNTTSIFTFSTSGDFLYHLLRLGMHFEFYRELKILATGKRFPRALGADEKVLGQFIISAMPKILKEEIIRRLTEDKSKTHWWFHRVWIGAILDRSIKLLGQVQEKEGSYSRGKPTAEESRRAEVRLTSVKSSTALPLAEESQRAELHSTPAGLSTLKPPTEESRRAEARNAGQQLAFDTLSLSAKGKNIVALDEYFQHLSPERRKQLIENPRMMEKELYQNVESIRKAIEFLGFSVVEENGILYISDSIFARKIEFRAYEVMLAAHAVFQDSVIILPTGLGKTIVATLVLGHLIKKNPKTKILFTAPANVLVAQHAETLSHLWVEEDLLALDQFLRKGTVAKITSNDTPAERMEIWNRSNVIIATNDLIVTGAEPLPLKEVDRLIVDEAHRVGQQDYAGSKLLDRYRTVNPNGILLGLTASPPLPEKLEDWKQKLRIENDHLLAATDIDPWIWPYIKNRHIEKQEVEWDMRFQLASSILDYLGWVVHDEGISDSPLDFGGLKARTFQAFARHPKEAYTEFSQILDEASTLLTQSSKVDVLRRKYALQLRFLSQAGRQLLKFLFEVRENEKRLAEFNYGKWTDFVAQKLPDDPVFQGVRRVIIQSIGELMVFQMEIALTFLIEESLLKLWDIYQSNGEPSLLKKKETTPMDHSKIDFQKLYAELYRQGLTRVPKDLFAAYQRATEQKRWNEIERLGELIHYHHLINLQHGLDQYGPRYVADYLEIQARKEGKIWSNRTLPHLKRFRIDPLARWLKEHQVESPKVEALLKLIEPVVKDPSKKVGVFVENRRVALDLVKTIRERLNIKAEALVGQPTSDDIALEDDPEMRRGMTPSQQEQVVRDFNEGKISVLVGTSIMREGLNIAGLKLVVAYVTATSAIEQIQRWGRVARFEEGRAVTLIMKGRKRDASIEEKVYLRVQNQAKRTRNLIRHLQELHPYTQFDIPQVEEKTFLVRAEVRDKIKPEEVTDARAVEFWQMSRELLSLFSNFKKLSQEQREKALPQSLEIYSDRLHFYINEVRFQDPKENQKWEALRGRSPPELKQLSDELDQKIKGFTPKFIKAYEAREQNELDRLNQEVVPLLKSRLKIQLLRLQYELRTPFLKRRGPMFLILYSVIDLYRRLSYEHTWRRRRAQGEAEISRFRMGDATGHLVFNLFYEKEPVLRVERDDQGKLQLTQIVWKYVPVEGGEKALQPVYIPIQFDELEDALRSRIHALESEEEEYAQLVYHDFALEDLERTLKDHQARSVPLSSALKTQILNIIHSILKGPKGKRGLGGKIAHVKDHSKVLPMPGPNLEAAHASIEAGNLATALSLIQSASRYIPLRLRDIERSRDATIRKRDYVYLLLRSQRTHQALHHVIEILSERALSLKKLEEAVEELESLYRTYYHFVIREKGYQFFQRQIINHTAALKTLEKDLSRKRFDHRIASLPVEGIKLKINQTLNGLDRRTQNLQRIEHRAEVRSTPVGLSTLAPQAAESLRAEVREDNRRQALEELSFASVALEPQSFRVQLMGLAVRKSDHYPVGLRVSYKGINGFIPGRYLPDPPEEYLNRKVKVIDAHLIDLKGDSPIFAIELPETIKHLKKKGRERRRAEVRSIPVESSTAPTHINKLPVEIHKEVGTVLPSNENSLRGRAVVPQAAESPRAEVRSLSEEKIRAFKQDLGIGREDLAQAIVKFPPLAGLNPARVRDEFNRELGIEQNALAQAILKHPPLAGYNPARNLKPKLEILRKIGVPQEEELKNLILLASANALVIQLINEISEQKSVKLKSASHINLIYRKLNRQLRQEGKLTVGKLLKSDPQALQTIIRPLLIQIVRAEMRTKESRRAEVRMRNIRSSGRWNPNDIKRIMNFVEKHASPKLILVGGAFGAGKSTLIRDLSDWWNVDFNNDSFLYGSSFHRLHDELVGGKTGDGFSNRSTLKTGLRLYAESLERDFQEGSKPPQFDFLRIGPNYYFVRFLANKWRKLFDGKHNLLLIEYVDAPKWVSQVEAWKGVDERLEQTFIDIPILKIIVEKVREPQRRLIRLEETTLGKEREKSLSRAEVPTSSVRAGDSPSSRRSGARAEAREQDQDEKREIEELAAVIQNKLEKEVNIDDLASLLGLIGNEKTDVQIAALHDLDYADRAIDSLLVPSDEFIQSIETTLRRLQLTEDEEKMLIEALIKKNPHVTVHLHQKGLVEKVPIPRETVGSFVRGLQVTQRLDPGLDIILEEKLGRGGLVTIVRAKFRRFRWDQSMVEITKRFLEGANPHDESFFLSELDYLGHKWSALGGAKEEFVQKLEERRRAIVDQLDDWEETNDTLDVEKMIPEVWMMNRVLLPMTLSTEVEKLTKELEFLNDILMTFQPDRIRDRYMAMRALDGKSIVTATSKEEMKIEFSRDHVRFDRARNHEVGGQENTETSETHISFKIGHLGIFDWIYFLKSNQPGRESEAPYVKGVITDTGEIIIEEVYFYPLRPRGALMPLLKLVHDELSQLQGPSRLTLVPEEVHTLLTFANSILKEAEQREESHKPSIQSLKANMPKYEKFQKDQPGVYFSFRQEVMNEFREDLVSILNEMPDMIHVFRGVLPQTLWGKRLIDAGFTNITVDLKPRIEGIEHFEISAEVQGRAEVRSALVEPSTAPTHINKLPVEINKEVGTVLPSNGNLLRGRAVAPQAAESPRAEVRSIEIEKDLDRGKELTDEMIRLVMSFMVRFVNDHEYDNLEWMFEYIPHPVLIAVYAFAIQHQRQTLEFIQSGEVERKLNELFDFLDRLANPEQKDNHGNSLREAAEMVRIYYESKVVSTNLYDELPIGRLSIAKPILQYYIPFSRSRETLKAEIIRLRDSLKEKDKELRPIIARLKAAAESRAEARSKRIERIELNPFRSSEQPIQVAPRVIHKMVELIKLGAKQQREYGLLLFGREGKATHFKGGFIGDDHSIVFRTRQSEKIVKQWMAKGFRFIGYFHTHPSSEDTNKTGRPMEIKDLRVSSKDKQSYYAAHGQDRLKSDHPTLPYRWNLKVNPLEFIGGLLPDRTIVIGAHQMRSFFKETDPVDHKEYLFSMTSEIPITVLEGRSQRRAEVRKRSLGQLPTLTSNRDILFEKPGIEMRTASSTPVSRSSTADKRSSTADKRLGSGATTSPIWSILPSRDSSKVPTSVTEYPSLSLAGLLGFIGDLSSYVGTNGVGKIINQRTHFVKAGVPTRFQRAEVRLTSVKSSTAQPSAVEGRRAELRQR
ncbi:MAG: LOG family protein, partial [Candidatus Omnitrophica bacterium]|nr:LOG family protein [Candidatus Omnitrophota bacterium]